MALEAAKQFLQELRTNETARRKLEAAHQKAEQHRTQTLAEAARESGYDVSEEDMHQVLEGLKKASDRTAEEIQALDEAELSEAAGGKGHKDCMDTYRSSENCWFKDNCRKVVNMYCPKHNGTCSSYTFCSEITVHNN